MCGDFNAKPEYASLKLINDTKLFQSVYPDSTFTTFSIREDTHFKVLDYVFYHNLGLVRRKEVMK